MAIRKHPTKGPGWWQIVISQGRNKPQRVLTYQGTEAEARSYDAELRGMPHNLADCKVVDLTGRFFDTDALAWSEKTVSERKRIFGILLPILGDRHLTLLHRTDYERYKNKRALDGVSKRTVNIELLAFRSFLTWCRKNGYQHGEVPELYSKKSTKAKLPIVLSRDELSRLMKELKGDRKTLAQLMAWCGLRKTEALGLKCGDVDLDHNLLRITGKGNKTRLVPINGATLKNALQGAIKGRDIAEAVYKNESTGEAYGEIVRGIKGAARKAGITKKINNHLLRHTFGALFVGQGGSVRALQEILGHEDLRTTMIYSQIAAEFIQGESNKLASIFDDPSDISDMAPEYII